MQMNHLLAAQNRAVQLSRQLLLGAIFLSLGLALASVPNQVEGPSLLHISQGHGVSASDVVALIPLVLGASLIMHGLWQTRTQLWTQLNARLRSGGIDILLIGMAIGVIMTRFTVDLPWGRLFVWIFITGIGALRFFSMPHRAGGLDQ